ncbi:DNA-3-methyladenine glycosylase I [Streptomyces sp. NPDC008122]|uniref:DNA-3-methyladenine glycosylase I n=1 Tax=Streptomyces sp. NPDC008122 TaxID=3364810 RepID=UPI0036E0E3F8
MTAFIAPVGEPRCGWAGGVPEFLDHRDGEWGFPVVDDRLLFEKISLEGFRSGLGRRTVPAERENFRKAFAGFDFHLVAEFTEAGVDRLLQDPGIVLHRGKIEAVVDNARRAVDLAAEEGSPAAFFWRGEPGPDEVDPPQTVSTSPAEPGRCEGAPPDADPVTDGWPMFDRWCRCPVFRQALTGVLGGGR